MREVFDKVKKVSEKDLYDRQDVTKAEFMALMEESFPKYKSAMRDRKKEPFFLDMLRLALRL